MKNYIEIIVILACFGCSAVAQQQPAKVSNVNAAESMAKASDSGIITSMTLEDFEKFLQGMGFECTRDKDANGNEKMFVTFKAEGYKVAAFVPNPKFLELYNAFNDVALTPAAVNEWNQANRFSRAYIGKDGYATLEDDLILSGGVTHENVEIFVTTFRDTVARWARFAIDHQVKEATK